MRVLAIDPGNIDSGFVIVDFSEVKVLDKGKVPNNEIFTVIEENKDCILAIEMIASYGMAVGKSVFDTCVWIGRFYQFAAEKGIKIEFVYRKDEKMTLCHSMKAKDTNIKQALIDIYAPNTSNNGKGTKKEPGFFYGFKADIWQAMAIAHTYKEMVEISTQK